MKALELFGCIALDDGRLYLLEDLDIECWDGDHKLWAILLACPTIILWVVWAPCYMYYKLWKNSNLLKFKDVMEYYGFFYNGLK